MGGEKKKFQEGGIGQGVKNFLSADHIFLKFWAYLPLNEKFLCSCMARRGIYWGEINKMGAYIGIRFQTLLYMIYFLRRQIHINVLIFQLFVYILFTLLLFLLPFNPSRQIVVIPMNFLVWKNMHNK